MNIHFRELWKSLWTPDFEKDSWSIERPLLKSLSPVESKWNVTIPLRTYFERRLALIEIDVLVSMSIGLTIEELILIYKIQFPVLYQNEEDTWYDQRGNIVFTCSKGLTGVGVDRPIWDSIKDLKDGETYDHTIEKSELYYGEKVTYYAPFEKCDRVEDYKVAWAHFE